MRRGAFRADRPRRSGAGGKGYQLHDRRLALMGSLPERGAGVGAIRTIKYPLAPPLGMANTDTLASACRSDALSVFGALNFSDWLEQRRATSTATYSFLDFWIDALALGGVLQPSKAKLSELASTLGGRDQVALFASKIRACVREELRDRLDYRELYWFVRKRQRATGGAGKVKAIFTERAKKEAGALIEAMVGAYGELPPMSTKVPAVERARAKLGLFAEVSDELLEEFFGAEEAERDKNREDVRDIDLTFLILPVLPSYPLPDIKEVLHASRGERVNAILAGWEQRRQLFGDTYNPEAFLGLTENFNALSNFGNKFLSELREPQGVDSIAAAMEQRLQCSPEHQAEVRRRLGVLRERARWLRDELSLMSNYSDYRQDLGGKLGSWFSNRQNYRENIEKELSRSKDILEKRIVDVEKKGGDASGLLERLKWQLELTKEIAGRASSSSEMFSPEVRILYEELLHINALGETAWNEHCLARLKEEPAKRKGTKAKRGDRQENVQHITLPKFPSFFGDERRLKYLKFIESPRILDETLRQICQLLRSSTVPERLARDAEQRAKAAQRVLMGTRRVVAACGRHRGITCSERVAELFIKPKEPKGYYKNPYSRRLVEKLPEPSYEELLLALRQLSSAVAEGLQGWDRDIQTPLGLRVVKASSQLAATLISIRFEEEQGKRELLAAIESIAALTIKSSGAPAFPSLVPLVDPRRASEERLALVGQALSRAMSEISGLVSLLSKQRIVERYGIQAENGKQTDVYVSNASAPERARFAVGFPRWRAGEAERVCEEYPFTFIRANAKQADLRPNKKPLTLYPIESSKYQVQFLRWALRRPARKKCEADPGGSFLITEKCVQLRVTKDDVQIAPGNEQARCYVSIPFTLKPAPSDSETREVSPGSELPFDPNIVVGIDVGEYALAYSVVQRSITPGGPCYKVLESGIVSDGTHRVLRERVARLQRRQRTGVFAAPDTSVAGARETLVGSYTNKLHRLALRHRARLVFEWNISAFEAGGNRVKTVYNSVKRADCLVRSGTDADKARRKHIWGLANPDSGREVDATGTSQTCACCRWWFRDYLDRCEDAEIKAALTTATVRERGGYYDAHEVNIKGRRLSFFLPPNKRQAADRLSVDELQGAIRDFMRPPLWRLGKGVLPKNARRRRGNSAAYRCPFVDCGHVADADVQASFNIAVRSFLSTKGNYKRGEELRAAYREVQTVPPGLERRFFGGGESHSPVSALERPSVSV